MTTTENNLVTAASVEEVVAAIEAIDLAAAWQDVAPNLRLALPRRRPLPVDAESLPTREFPPGIDAVLGLDIGPAMLFVCHEQLDDWGVSADRAFDQALANVSARVEAQSHFALVHERILEVPTLAFQSREGWASSLLLLPEELTRVFGARDGIVVAPMRDVIFLLPLDANPLVALLLQEEFADADMNALDLPIFGLLDGELHLAAVVPDEAAGLIQ